MLASHKHNLFVPIQHFWNKGYNHEVSWQLQFNCKQFYFLMRNKFLKIEWNLEKKLKSFASHSFSALETILSETA